MGVLVLLPRWQGAGRAPQPLSPPARRALEETDFGQVLEILGPLSQFLKEAPREVGLHTLERIAVNLA